MQGAARVLLTALLMAFMLAAISGVLYDLYGWPGAVFGTPLMVGFAATICWISEKLTLGKK